MSLIVYPSPNRLPITIEGETVVISAKTEVPNTPYYQRHIDAGDLLVANEDDTSDGQTETKDQA